MPIRMLEDHRISINLMSPEILPIWILAAIPVARVDWYNCTIIEMPLPLIFKSLPREERATHRQDEGWEYHRRGPRTWVEVEEDTIEVPEDNLALAERQHAIERAVLHKNAR